MAGGGGGGGDKRSSNADLNLVPYIDLLSTLICFLLITAVWQQVSVVSTNIEKVTPEAADPLAFNPDPQKDENKIEISLTLKKGTIEVNANKVITEIRHIDDNLDKDAIKKILDNWKAQYPDKKLVTLKSEAGSEYRSLIQAMDLLTENKFTDVAISTN